MISLQVLDVPSAPTGLQGVAANDQVTLSWGASQPNGAPVTNYVITMQGGGTKDAVGTTYTWTELQNGQSYTFTVVAQNQVGPSSPSGAGTFSPKSEPEAPQDVTAQGGNGEATVSWQAANPNGQPILGYSVTVSPASGGATSQTVGADVTTLTWQGLSNNTGPYSFIVTARNSVGPGPPSAPSKPIYAHGTPTTPAAPTATGSVSPDQTTTTITVSWPSMAPCNDAQPCESYIVTELKGGAVAASLPTSGDCGGSSSQCTASFGPITNDGSEYMYELQAVNQEGDTSSMSPPSAVVHADGVPGQITDLTATAENSSAQVSFTLPPSHGASIAAVNYQVSSSSQSTSGSWPNPGASGQSVTKTISGLSPLVAYSITVTATNELDEPGPASSPATVTPYGDPQPPSVTASPNGNTVTYSWSGGGNEGLAVKTYTYCINGACNQTSGPSGTSASYACGQTETLTAYVTDTANQQSSTASTQASTSTCPPPPQPTVTISWGGSAPSGNCGGDATCKYIEISVANFSPGTYGVTYYDNHPDNGSWWTENISVGSNGSGSVSNNTWFGYGGKGYSIWAVVNGVMSNTITS